jgi:hypothetical protein
MLEAEGGLTIKVSAESQWARPPTDDHVGCDRAELT